MNKISVHELLEVVADFDENGGGSPGLIAWEVFADEHDILPVWELAIAEGWLIPAGRDLAYDEQLYRLTLSGWVAARERSPRTQVRTRSRRRVHEALLLEAPRTATTVRGASLFSAETSVHAASVDLVDRRTTARRTGYEFHRSTHPSPRGRPEALIPVRRTATGSPEWWYNTGRVVGPDAPGARRGARPRPATQQRAPRAAQSRPGRRCTPRCAGTRSALARPGISDAMSSQRPMSTDARRSDPKPPGQLPPAVKAEAQRILDRAAQRLLQELQQSQRDAA
jgi:hypothetical protein